MCIYIHCVCNVVRKVSIYLALFYSDFSVLTFPTRVLNIRGSKAIYTQFLCLALIEWQNLISSHNLGAFFGKRESLDMSFPAIF